MNLIDSNLLDHVTGGHQTERDHRQRWREMPWELQRECPWGMHREWVPGGTACFPNLGR